jgi:hypothetical protein
VERGEEIPRGLIIACGDAAELFEFAEEILDEVACLVKRLIELAGFGSVLPRRDDGGFSGTCQRFENTVIGIVGLVGDQDLGDHLRQQCIGAGEIMGLPRVSRKRSGLPCASTKAWILVLNPPLLRPIA